MKNENEKVVLHEKLQEVLDTIGNNPFDEPEIFEAIDVERPRKVKAVKIALERKGLNSKDFDAKEIGMFFNLMKDKISGLKLEDGSYKVTKNTKNYRFPDFEEVELMGDLGLDLNELYKKQSLLVDTSDIEENAANIMQILKDMDELMWVVTGLNKDKLTAWEVKLISEQIFTYATNVDNTSMGKPLSI